MVCCFAQDLHRHVHPYAVSGAILSSFPAVRGHEEEEEDRGTEGGDGGSSQSKGCCIVKIACSCTASCTLDGCDRGLPGRDHQFQLVVCYCKRDGDGAASSRRPCGFGWMRRRRRGRQQHAQQRSCKKIAKLYRNLEIQYLIQF